MAQKERHGTEEWATVQAAHVGRYAVAVGVELIAADGAMPARPRLYFSASVAAEAATAMTRAGRGDCRPVRLVPISLIISEGDLDCLREAKASRALPHSVAVVLDSSDADDDEARLTGGAAVDFLDMACSSTTAVGARTEVLDDPSGKAAARLGFLVIDREVRGIEAVCSRCEARLGFLAGCDEFAEGQRLCEQCDADDGDEE